MVGVAQSKNLLIEGKNRIWIFEFTRHIVGFETGRNRQPGFLPAETGMGCIVPLHGSSFTISALFLWPAQLANGILHVFLAFRVIVFHPNLFSVIHDRSSPERQIQPCHEFGNSVIVLPISIANVRARDVVVADDVDWPASGGIDGPDLATEFRRRNFVDRGEHQIHGHLQFVAMLAVVFL